MAQIAVKTGSGKPIDGTLKKGQIGLRLDSGDEAIYTGDSDTEPTTIKLTNNYSDTDRDKVANITTTEPADLDSINTSVGKLTTANSITGKLADATCSVTNDGSIPINLQSSDLIVPITTSVATNDATILDTDDTGNSITFNKAGRYAFNITSYVRSGDIETSDYIISLMDGNGALIDVNSYASTSIVSTVTGTLTKVFNEIVVDITSSDIPAAIWLKVRTSPVSSFIFEGFDVDVLASGNEITDAEKAAWNAKQDPLVADSDYLTPNTASTTYEQKDSDIVKDSSYVHTDNNYTTSDKSKLSGVANNANAYTHPTYAGDDASIDTGALSGATVISDLDFNVTTDTNGHVTDANATVATRNLTATNIGAMPKSGGTFTGNINLGAYNISDVTNIYLDNIMYSTGDTNTYFQFHAADQARIVAGGTERFEVNNTGIKVTGNIAVSGTVDGRDIAADGSKLNTIATNATANSSESVNESANTLVKRDGSGYIHNNYFNSSASFTSGTPTAVWVETGSDGFLRKMTLANLANKLKSEGLGMQFAVASNNIRLEYLTQEASSSYNADNIDSIDGTSYVRFVVPYTGIVRLTYDMRIYDQSYYVSSIIRYGNWTPSTSSVYRLSNSLENYSSTKASTSETTYVSYSHDIQVTANEPVYLIFVSNGGATSYHRNVRVKYDLTSAQDYGTII